MTIRSPGEETHAGAEHFCRTVGRMVGDASGSEVLVAGCGRGHEALFIRKQLGCKVIGVDVSQHWDPLETWGADVPDFELLVSSVLDLPFPENSFDIVFFHHVIEHVSDPAGALDELARVLRPGGMIYVGTPNRHRAIGYVGSFDATTMQKVKWNLHDYKARVRGKFRNEHGAHAGFSEKELSDLLTFRFDPVRVLTADYLKFKYGARVPRIVIDSICLDPVREFAAPSVYFVGNLPTQTP